MLDAFFVTLRELAELLLIAGAMRLCLQQNGRQDLAPLVLPSASVGVAAALGLSAWAVTSEMPQEAVAIATVIFAAGVLLLTTGMLSSAQGIRRHTDAVMSHWIASVDGRLPVVAFAGFAGFREAMEVTLFLRPLVSTDGAADAMTGVLLGLAGGAGLTLLYRRAHARFELLWLFRLSAVLMALLSIHLLIAGLGELLHVQFPPDSELLLAANPFLDGGRWHGLLCGLLLVPPLVSLARSWWHEAALR